MDQAEEERRRRVALAVANQELEGLVVSEDTLRIADRYIVGEASAEEAAAMILERYGISGK